MDATLMPRRFGEMEKPTRRFGWMTLLAAGLVCLMIVTSLWINGGTPPPDDLGWAPGMGSSNSISLASPPASPSAANQGSKYACDAPSLTSDEVMAIVLNPLQSYEQRGHEFNYDPPLPKYREEDPADRANWSTVVLSPTSGTETSIELEALGTQFWNCLMTGTSYQVWGMMDPTLLQWSILRNFPVIRDEVKLREFVERWGPQQFGKSGLDIFPIVSGLPPEQVARVVNTDFGSIRVSTPRGPEEMETRIGVITLVPANGGDDLNYYELLVSEHPDGTWSVNGLEVNPNMPRG